MKAGGYLYAISAEGTPFVKIGCAVNVERRLKALQTAHPLTLRLLAQVCVAADMYRIERRVHGFLAEHRRQGEWFDDITMDTEQLTALVARAGAALDPVKDLSRHRPQPRRKSSLTYFLIDSTPCPQTGETWLSDDSLPGFGIRLRPGRKTYCLRYRNPGGKTQRVNFGVVTVLSLAQAREMARKHLAMVYPSSY